jgi:phosphatidylserine/phosphatidylglycerophosphate/cardiolipin synthase-like enzyme
MYALTDPALISLLHQKAQEGVRVVALYDPSASPSLTPFPWAYPVAAGGLMHRKILTVDDALVFFGSANMTSSSLDVHDNLTLGLHHPPLARFLRTCAAPSFLFRIYEQCAELWLLPDQQQRALTRLLHLIQRARTSIYVAMFTLTHPALLEALIEAHRRGVDVQVLLDFYTEQGASRKGAQRLLDAGVSLAISRGRQLLHHKMAYIDREVLVTGSANWTRSAFAKNQDGFIILHSLKRKQRHTLDAMWRALLLESEPR